jgi:hypothetical protein
MQRLLCNVRTVANWQVLSRRLIWIVIAIVRRDRTRTPIVDHNFRTFALGDLMRPKVLGREDVCDAAAEVAAEVDHVERDEGSGGVRSSVFEVVRGAILIVVQESVMVVLFRTNQCKIEGVSSGLSLDY